ncbi:MAG: 50S ribosomal protein L14 [Candidatus Woesearchaeota archaeon]|jgi:large subunit ribosomal protein L14
MKSIKATNTRPLPYGAHMNTCDNSGAKIVKVFAVIGHKTRKGRIQACGIGDEIVCVVKKGKPDMRRTVVRAVIVRQKKEFRRADGTRVQFEDNACIILKDDKGNPKGTILKGPIAKEIAERWPAVAKIASIIL